jgi:hypothetical protein
LTAYNLDSIRTQLERMRTLTRSAELSTCRERVSGWCPAEHLDHLVKVTESVVGVLGDPDARPLPKSINAIGRLVLRLGWIPRGIGKSPKRLTGTRAPATDLEAAVARLAQAFDALPFAALRASRVPIVRHPVFGGLNPPQALRFLEVHNAHHLKIVADILEP